MPPLDDSITTRKRLAGLTGRRYWRSLDELARTPQFAAAMEREFPEVAVDALSPESRREFLKLMGASLALAGLTLTGCRWPRETIAPYAKRPQGFTPGQPAQYATAMELGGAAVGLLVTSYDGRPIKIEGNPLHPASRGATTAIHQASVLDLYDIDRASQVVQRQGGQTLQPGLEGFRQFASERFAGLRTRGGEGLALLLEETGSPTTLAMRAQLRDSMPLAQQFVYEPVSRDNQRQAMRRLYGRAYRPLLRLEGADVIASFDDDFLLLHPDGVRHAREFAARRNPDSGAMNRLYVLESTVSLTGTNADHRAALRPGQVALQLRILAARLFLKSGLSLPAGAEHLEGLLRVHMNDVNEHPLLEPLCKDLLRHRGRSLLTVGPRQTADVHVLAQLINDALGNVGKTVELVPDPRQDHGDRAQIEELAGQLKAGAISTLVIAGGNPVYNAPPELSVAGKLAGAETVIHLSQDENETSQHCSWLLPRAHYLEAWGDATGWDGTYSVIQPLIEPLYGGLSEIELLSMLISAEPRSGYELVRETYAQRFGEDDFEARWRTALHDGLVAGSASAPARPTPDYGRALTGTDLDGVRVYGEEAATDGFELAVVPDPRVYDGRFANNGWLQEAPDPLTKLTWDNAAVISVADAAAQGLRDGDVIELPPDSGVKLPVLVMPGQPRGVITVALGYGRQVCGRVGRGVGVNAYALRPQEHGGAAQVMQPRKTGRTHELACTQDHYVIDTLGMAERERRVGGLVREANLAFYHEHPDFAQKMTHHPPLKSLWTEHSYEGHRWALAIDLSSCIGCGACITACQAENNIPVVGKQRVLEGREMHWIRVDRYFTGDPAAPQSLSQPVACHHCEMAPCEQVCPVAATVHSSEGLNEMVYNRCVGTRYCANNCPYKVRRFNYFNYQKGITETQKLGFNPEVTVRSRGVMEKCTYCVQRIQGAKIDAGNEQRPLEDGEITPACAQACPARAITFGDLNDPDSAVRKLHDHQRAYAMLAELNVKPRTAYLAKLRNPAPGTPEYETPPPELYEHAEEHDEHAGHAGEGDGHAAAGEGEGH